VDKAAGRDADHSPPSNAEVKNSWSYTFIPLIRLHGVVLNEAMAASLWTSAWLRTGKILPLWILEK
jgi:hypothetical protein